MTQTEERLNRITEIAERYALKLRAMAIELASTKGDRIDRIIQQVSSGHLIAASGQMDVLAHACQELAKRAPEARKERQLQVEEEIAAIIAFISTDPDKGPEGGGKPN